jgi:hypothetical protein
VKGRACGIFCRILGGSGGHLALHLSEFEAEESPTAAEESLLIGLVTGFGVTVAIFDGLLPLRRPSELRPKCLDASP